MRLALLDYQDQPLPMPHSDLATELKSRLQKRLWPMTSRATVLQEVDAALAEIESEARAHSVRV